MPAKLQIQKIEKLDVQADNTTVLDVTFNLLDTESGEVIETKRHNFPLNTTEEQMTEELQKVVTAYNIDAENAVKNAELEASHKIADETIEKMSGKEIGQTEVKAEEPATPEPEKPAEEGQAQE